MKPFWIVILSIIFSTTPVYAGEFTIHIDESYPPFSYTEDGKPKGIYVDILNRVFSKLDGHTVKLQGITWNRGKHLMKTGKGFALMPPYFHGHDWPYLYPYSLSFYTETVVSYCKKSLLNKPRKWPNEFVGLSVGNITGYDGWGGKAFRQLVADKKIIYKDFSRPSQLVKFLLVGLIDCIMMEQTAFKIAKKHIEETSDTSKFIEIKSGPVIGQDPVYIGYSEAALKLNKYENAYDFRKQVDGIIYQLLKSGEIEAIIDRYINESQ